MGRTAETGGGTGVSILGPTTALIFKCERIHFFGAAVTSIVSGVHGSATRTLGLLVAFGSLLNGTCASPRTTMVYVPGGTLLPTLILRAASVLSAAISVVARLKPGGRLRPLSWTLPLKSGQCRSTETFVSKLPPAWTVAGSAGIFRP